MNALPPTWPQPLERGLWGILATPFHEPDRRIDEKSLRRQVRLFAEIGAAGVVALGVFGEGASLNLAEQRQVVAAVVDEADGLPVVAGLSPLRTAPVLEQAHAVLDAAGGRLRALMVQLNTPRVEPLVEHFHAVHDATQTGIVAQDYPVASGVHVPTDVLIETVRRSPFVVAVKAEAPPTPLAVARLTAALDVPVFGGLGGIGLIDELAAGAAGAMTGFSRPEALRDAITAYDAGGVTAAHQAFAPWLPLANFEVQAGIALPLRREPFVGGDISAGITVRPPAAAFPAELSGLLTAHLDALGVAETEGVRT